MGIRILNLARAFSGKLVFRAESISSPERGLVILRGENGSGKTSLLRILATTLWPSEGEAWIGDFSVRREPDSVRKRVGFMDSASGFYPRLTGEENLFLFARLRGLSDRETKQAINRHRATFLTSAVLSTPYLFASSGMRQALALGRALLHDPEVLLLDEPSNSLDERATKRLHAFLQERASSHLILMASHRPEEWRMARQIWEFRGGRLDAKNP